MEEQEKMENQQPETAPEKPDWQTHALWYLHDVVYILAAIVLVCILLFRVVIVSGTSMNDTLMDGDYLLLLSNVWYREPQAGDIVVAGKEEFDDGKPIIKRVIATEGQWVDIDFEAGIVYVGDDPEHMQPLDEPYTKTPTTLKQGTTFPLQVEEDCIFVLGDNRNKSRDSRYPQIGLINKQEVLGKVLFLCFPGTNKGEVALDLGRIGVIG